MYPYLQSLEKYGINLGLDRIEFLLQELGSPHLKFKSIHVAGTNGKGSTCAMLVSILKEAGYKVGLYTSPHLFDWRERVKINGTDISRKEFQNGLRLIKAIAEKASLKPTVFEVLTAVAFWYFAKKKVDCAVVEVGMGGRLDATNVITPLVSVITNIDYEHTAVLGKTLAKIAREKGGIIKPGVPVVTAEGKKEPLDVIKKLCLSKSSRLVIVRRKAEKLKSRKLLGSHQKINAACAITAIRLAGIKISREAVSKGLNKVEWPARFQIIARKPLTIVDGAHNPAGAKVLAQTLREKYPKQKFTFILGVQKDKDAASMLKIFRPLAKEIIITSSSNPLAAEKIGGKIAEPLDQILGRTKNVPRIICGSLFLAADALKCLDAADGL